jgi:hypothetical protein
MKNTALAVLMTLFLACPVTVMVALLAPFLISPAMAQTAPEIAGEWYGTVAAPTGDATLILYVTRTRDGALEAGLEARDQAPGRKAPVTEIAAADGRLTFKVPAIRATYEGTWDEATQQWLGALIQAQPTALNFSKGLPPPKPRVEGLDGLWEGAVENNGVKLRQVLRIASGEWGTNALFDSPDQQVANLPLGDFVREGSAVRFSIARGAARFEGMLSADGERLTGMWAASGQLETTVTFIRTQAVAERAPPARPQNPREPLPYKVEEVIFDNPAAPGVRLAGTLTLPQGQGPFSVAIMISGSGQHDRDETLDGHKPFLVIADHLTRDGVAVLRFDDRGAGQSTGDPRTATPADKASDANAAFAYLSGRPDIRHDAIGFIGHSEGGLIGPIAMASNDKAAFLVSLAGPAADMLEVMLAQLRLVLPSEGMSMEQVTRFQAVFSAIFKAMATAETPEAGRSAVTALLTPEAKAALGMAPDSDSVLILRELAGPRVQYLAKYDPAPNLARIAVPVLALNGSLDLQVAPEQNLAAFREAVKDNPDATIMELAGLNHMFQTAKTGARGEYRDIEETFAPVALETISGWLAEHGFVGVSR